MDRGLTVGVLAEVYFHHGLAFILCQGEDILRFVGRVLQAQIIAEGLEAQAPKSRGN